MKLNQDSIASCMRILKIFIVIFSAVFFVLGFATFIVGCVARSSFSLGSLENVLPRIHEGSNLLIFVGLLLMGLGVVGVLGALRENKYLLVAFFVMLFFSFSFLMAAGIWAVAWKEKFGWILINKLRDYVKALEEAEFTGLKNEKAQTMDWIQDKFKCCGEKSADDYSGKKPSSCIRQYWDTGCYDAIVQAFKGHIGKISGLGITVGFFSIFGMVASLTFCCALHEQG